MTNEILWTKVEGLAVEYSESINLFEKELKMAEIFNVMAKYINTCVINSVANARNNGLFIPKEDFESRYMQYLWEAVEAYNKEDGYSFKNIVIRRFRFAEAHTWRQYKAKGSENDKDGITYDSARWDSLDRKVEGDSSEGNKTLADFVLGEGVSAEDAYMQQYEEMEIINEFAEVSERYATIIRLMVLGYDGDTLAIASGESDSYDAKMRKLVQRAKQSFKKFMDERMVNL